MALGETMEETKTLVRLSDEMRSRIVELLAAGERVTKIKRILDKTYGVSPSLNTISYYKKQFSAEIEAAAEERYDAAIKTGLARRGARLEELTGMFVKVKGRLTGTDIDAEDYSKVSSANIPLQKQAVELLNQIRQEAEALEPLKSQRIELGLPGAFDPKALSDDELRQITAGK